MGPKRARRHRGCVFEIRLRRDRPPEQLLFRVTDRVAQLLRQPSTEHHARGLQLSRAPREFPPRESVHFVVYVTAVVAILVRVRPPEHLVAVRQPDHRSRLHVLPRDHVANLVSRRRCRRGRCAGGHSGVRGDATRAQHPGDVMGLEHLRDTDDRARVRVQHGDASADRITIRHHIRCGIRARLLGLPEEHVPAAHLPPQNLPEARRLSPIDDDDRDRIHRRVSPRCRLQGRPQHTPHRDDVVPRAELRCERLARRVVQTLGEHGRRALVWVIG